MPPKLQLEGEEEPAERPPKKSKRKLEVAPELVIEDHPKSPTAKLVVSRPELGPQTKKRIKLEEVKKKVKAKPSLAPPRKNSLSVKQMILAMSSVEVKKNGRVLGLSNGKANPLQDQGTRPPETEVAALIGQLGEVEVKSEDLEASRGVRRGQPPAEEGREDPREASTARIQVEEPTSLS